MKNIVECVPNFSEGRNRVVVDQIVAAIQSIPGIYILDLEMDSDHNRSVITFVGEKENIAEAAFRGIHKASQLIDLTKHKGVHPRVGATDVVPFIPIRNATMEECIAIAHEVGKATGERLSIPVYLYEAAATRPESIRLENLRKGQFEGLREEIERNDERKPDYGPRQIHPTAGATIIGARKFLIAYNINLNTPDVAIAKRIARSIRTSSGGMPFVKAMGVELKTRNAAQVSMNLTDFEQTPIHRVFEQVKIEAEREGTSICGSEIIGLIPSKAIELAAESYLQFENFSPELILENRLKSVLETRKDLCALTMQQFIESVAKAETVPGGGSVSALAGALAAALGKMTIGFTLGRKKYETSREILEGELRSLEAFVPALQQAVDEDSKAYGGVMAALQMPKGTGTEKALRDHSLTEALTQATLIPLQVADQTCAVLNILQSLKGHSNPHLDSDLKVGIWIGIAAVKGALENVWTNLASLPKTERFENIKLQADDLNRFIDELYAANAQS
jgi:glutamate formiminotransferase / formiminotetrahydrofolate cyclodeaminase